METLRRIAKERIVYLDESGFDDRLNSPYGYCHQSQRFRAQKLGHPSKRVSVISAWREGEVLAPMIFEGYTNSALVCDWIEQMLLPEMLPGQILILDNASFHPKRKIEQLLAKAGCQVMFLPPYSPELNKIEKYWARLKQQVSKLLMQGHDLLDALTYAFKQVS